MFEFILAFLSTYGLSKLISTYDGPFDVFSRVRAIIPAARCTVCLSVWIAIPIVWYSGIGVLGYLSIVGAVILIEELA